jgi:hypothetical protein
MQAYRQFGKDEGYDLPELVESELKERFELYKRASGSTSVVILEAIDLA